MQTFFSGVHPSLGHQWSCFLALLRSKVQSLKKFGKIWKILKNENLEKMPYFWASISLF